MADYRRTTEPWHGRQRLRVAGELRDARFGVPSPAEVDFDKSLHVNVDFSGLKFASFYAHASLFERCDFSRLSFDHAGVVPEPGLFSREAPTATRASGS